MSKKLLLLWSYYLANHWVNLDFSALIHLIW